MVEDAMEATAKDTDGIPYCKKHHCRMRQASGGKKDSPTVYYKCPVIGCECRAQTIKVRDSMVPKDPVHCPKCKKSICERDECASNAMQVVLLCPTCKWRTAPLATPQFAALRDKQREGLRKQQQEIGQR